MNLLQEDIQNLEITEKSTKKQPIQRIYPKTNVNIENCDIQKFICDSSLSRVAKHLRLLGIDCSHDQDMTSAYLIYLAKNENRIILTRSKKLLCKIVPEPKKTDKEQEIESDEIKKWREEKAKYTKVHNEDIIEQDSENEESEEESEPNIYFYFLIETKGATTQIMEVVNHFQIEYQKSNLFTRCLECNTVIKQVDKESIKDKVYKDTFEHNKDFYFCEKCNKVFWGDEDNANYISANKFAEKYSFKK